MIIYDSRLSGTIIRTFINEISRDWCILNAENGHAALKLTVDRPIDMASMKIEMPNQEMIEIIVKPVIQDMFGVFAAGVS